MITVIFILTLYCPHTSYSSNRENVPVLFSIFITMRFFYFCISSFFLHFSLASEELGFNILWICYTFSVKALKSWRRGKSGYLFPWLFSQSGYGLAMTVFPLMKTSFLSLLARLCVLPIFKITALSFLPFKHNSGKSFQFYLI